MGEKALHCLSTWTCCLGYKDPLALLDDTTATAFKIPHTERCAGEYKLQPAVLWGKKNKIYNALE